VRHKRQRILPVPPLKQLLDSGEGINTRHNIEKIYDVVVESIIIEVSVHTPPGVDIREGETKLLVKLVSKVNTTQRCWDKPGRQYTQWIVM
jgi:hypothetical protein